MTFSRRKTLALIGGGVIVAAIGSGAMVASRSPKTAQAPWAQAGGYNDPRMRALSWAILAPNPHNLQSWKVDLAQPDKATLYVDQTRLLPHTDPFGRQITIGLGCFLEVLRMAALEDRLETNVTLFPQGSDPKTLDDRPIAEISFAPTTRGPDPLFAHVPSRRSLKEPYDTMRPVDQPILQALEAAVLTDIEVDTQVGTTSAPDRIADLRDITARALEIELTTPRTHKESIDVVRIGAKEIDAIPDGISLTGPLFELGKPLGLVNRAQMLDPSSQAFAAGLKITADNALSAMGFVWITTKNNTRKDQIRTGANWVRVNLAATAQGVGFHPMSQALQEYPEMAELYEQTHEMLAPEGGTVQMLCRLGYGPDVPPSPRWPIDAKVVNV